jgi:Carboxypeptidase regulatory-like domain
VVRYPAVVLVVVLLAAWPASAQTVRGRIEGRIADSSGLPLPGATVTLTHEARPPLVVHTDEVGHFALDVPYGRYTLTAELSGFDTAVRPNLTVGATPLVVDVTLDLGGFNEETQVIAQAPRVFSTTEPTAPVTIDKEIIKMAPVQGLRYDSALPLLPGAVRGPDGLITLSGARAWQGTVLVDHMRENDPVSGEPRLSLPISAIDSVQVYSPLPPADAGPGTGGVTVVNTKPAIDAYMFTVLGLVPRPRFSGDGTSGFEAWQPTFGFSGPLVRGRAWLAQSVEYRYERFQYETVAGKQDSSVHSWTTFSRLDLKPGGPHHFTLRLAVTPDSNRHYGLGAFAPANSVPDLNTTGVSIAALDRVALGGSSTLDSHVHVKRLALDMTGGAGEPYVIGHDQIRGSYYRTVDRTAYRVEVGTTWSKAVPKWHGEHLFKAGLAVGAMTVSGVEQSRPVDYVRSDGTLSRHYAFSGPGVFEASLVDGGLFVQDTWAVSASVKLDLGVRGDANTAATGFAFWPRAVVSYDIRPNSTKVTAGIGGFADQPLLAASVFPQRQSRLEMLYDASGRTLESSRLFTNRAVTPLAIPRSLAWSVQLDQTLKGGWMARAAYQERRGSREYTVQPGDLGPATGELGLRGDAGSMSRSLEATAGYRAAHGSHQVYVSYVRAWTDGHLNDLNSVAGSFVRPQVLPDARAPLPADVPHRLLAWGVISLPWRFTVSPFMEVRSGFPFTRIDEDWNVVGTRDDARYPTFMSVDLAVEKAIQLPFGLPARLGLKFFNLAGRNNGRSIQRDVQRPDFGRTYDPIRRQVRGTLEISWNR